jgi:hypothetical protein
MPLSYSLVRLIFIGTGSDAMKRCHCCQMGTPADREIASGGWVLRLNEQRPTVSDSGLPPPPPSALACSAAPPR